MLVATKMDFPPSMEGTIAENSNAGVVNNEQRDKLKKKQIKQTQQRQKEKIRKERAKKPQQNKVNY